MWPAMGATQSTSNFLVGPDNFTCTICHQKFENPKTLPCGHTYCLPCIQRLKRMSTAKGYLKCPMCRQEAELPLSGRVEDLPTNFALQRILQGATILQERRRQRKRNRPSEDCVGDSVSKVNCVYHNLACGSFCISCHLLVCVTCINTTHEPDSGHSIAEINELSRTQQESLSKMVNKLDTMYADTVKIVGIGYLLNYNYTNQMESIVSFKRKAEVFLAKIEETRKFCEDLRKGLLSNDRRSLLEVREVSAQFSDVLVKHEDLTRLCKVIVDELITYFQNFRTKVISLQSILCNSLVVFYLTGDKPPLVKGSPYRLLEQVQNVLQECDGLIEGFQTNNYQVISRNARMEKLWGEVCNTYDDLGVHLRNVVANHVMKMRQKMMLKVKLVSHYQLKIEKLESAIQIFLSKQIVSSFEETLDQTMNSILLGLSHCDEILESLENKTATEMRDIVSQLSDWEVQTVLLFNKLEHQRKQMKDKRYLMLKIIVWSILGIAFIDGIFRLKETVKV